jgi:hypothetical protein
MWVFPFTSSLADAKAFGGRSRAYLGVVRQDQQRGQGGEMKPRRLDGMRLLLR